MKAFFLCLAMALLCLATMPKVTAQGMAAHSAFDSAKAIQEIVHQTKAYIEAFSKSDSIGLGNLYITDARFLNHGSPSTIGRTALIHFFGEMMRDGVTGFAYATTGVWGSDNNIVVEEVACAFALSEGKVVSRGRYSLVLEKRRRHTENIPRYFFFGWESEKLGLIGDSNYTQ